MSTIKNFLLQITSNLIKLYPVSFQQEFSEEIRSTLHELLDEYANYGISILLMKWLSEICALFVSIFREHQRARNIGEIEMKQIQWSWKKAIAVLLPVLLWLGILQFIQSNIFYSSGMIYASFDGSIISRDQFFTLLSPLVKMLLLITSLDFFAPFSSGPAISFILLGLLIIGLEWWDEKHFPVIGLPSLGMIVYFAFIAVGNLLKISITTKEILSGVGPLLLLLVWLGWSQRTTHRKLPKTIWQLLIYLPFIVAATIIGSYLFNTALRIQPSYNQLIGGIGEQVRGALFVLGPTAFAVLVGSLFAPRYGSKAILFVTGFMCFVLMTPLSGLEANGGMMTTSIGMLGFELFQGVQSTLFVAAFFLVIPALYLSSSHPLARRLSIMIPIAAVFGIMVIVQGYEEGWTGHLIILLGNLTQGLICLNLAIHLYEHLYQIPDKTEAGAVQPTSKQKPVFMS
jgi:hypothetical protein